MPRKAKHITREDWARGQVKPFDYMDCFNCLTEHVQYGCTKHPEVAQAVTDAVGPIPDLYISSSGFNAERAEAFLNEKLAQFRKLRKRFAKYYQK